jgi:hypothetical protein
MIRGRHMQKTSLSGLVRRTLAGAVVVSVVPV